MANPNDPYNPRGTNPNPPNPNDPAPRGTSPNPNPNPKDPRSPTSNDPRDANYIGSRDAGDPARSDREYERTTGKSRGAQNTNTADMAERLEGLAEQLHGDMAAAGVEAIRDALRREVSALRQVGRDPSRA